MKVLFIGGTGIISQAVSKLLVEENIELYLFNRGNNSDLIPDGARLIKGNIRNKELSYDILKDYQFDVVVNWIAFNTEHIKTDIELFKDKIRQYIFISSASAYQKPLNNYLITESTPLCNPYWDYSQDKIACEELLLQEYRSNGFPVSIVRPSYTYGNTMIPAALNSWDYPWSLIDRMRKGKKIIVHGDGSSLWTMTHNSDFARGFIGLISNDKAIGHAFHITSDEVLTWDHIYQTIARAAGVEANLIHMASDYIISHYPEKKGSLLGDKAVSAVFDNSKIKSFVPDFKARVSFAEGIKRTINYFESNPEMCKIDSDWNKKMDMMIEAYEAI
ncbi:SDR family oxidoreductase [Natronospora cellulosivora (SeqCode)]